MLPRCSDMVRFFIVVALLLPVSRAHAMGANIGFTLLAWSPDGTHALLARESDNDGEYLKTDYEVVDVDETDAVDVMLTSTHRAGGIIDENIDAATCSASAKTLRDALRDAGFRGVSVNDGACATHRDRVVRVSKAQRARVLRSRVTGKAARALERRVTPDYEGPVVENGCESYRMEVAKAAELALVFEISTCETPSRVRVHGFGRDGAERWKLD